MLIAKVFWLVAVKLLRPYLRTEGFSPEDCAGRGLHQRERTFATIIRHSTVAAVSTVAFPRAAPVANFKRERNNYRDPSLDYTLMSHMFSIYAL
jgi:hypothetical protein